jgi:hypothetical protein
MDVLLEHIMFWEEGVLKMTSGIILALENFDNINALQAHIVLD